MRPDSHIQIQTHTHTKRKDKCGAAAQGHARLKKKKKPLGKDTEFLNTYWKSLDKWRVLLLIFTSVKWLWTSPVSEVLLCLIEDGKRFSFGERLQSYSVFTLPEKSPQAYIMQICPNFSFSGKTGILEKIHNTIRLTNSVSRRWSMVCSLSKNYRFQLECSRK